MVASQTLAVEVPDELLILLGSAEAVAAKVQEALVMALLRESAISQGQAARLLGLTRRVRVSIVGVRRRGRRWPTAH